MDWTFNRAGQWEGTDDGWQAIVFRRARQNTWDAAVYPAHLPANRQTQGGFVDVDAARAWCADIVGQLCQQRQLGER
jgi:hypothetical protein